MVSQISAPVTQHQLKMSAEDFKRVPKEIQEKGDAINDSLDSINNTMKRTTESVGGIAITGAGLLATLKKPFIGIINWLKEAKINPETGEKLLDEAGKVIKSDKFCKNKIIGVAIAAALVTAYAVIKKVSKNKAKKAEEANLARQTEQVEKSSEQQKEHKLDVVAA